MKKGHVFMALLLHHSFKQGLSFYLTENCHLPIPTSCCFPPLLVFLTIVVSTV